MTVMIATPERTLQLAGGSETLLVLVEERDAIVSAAFESVRRGGSHYQAAEQDRVRRRIAVLYDELLEAASSRDLTSVVDYARELATHRYQSGYDLSEVQGAINALEEATWGTLCARLQPEQLAVALGLVSTTLGAAKDALAREYVSLASQTRIPSLDMRALFTGSTGA